MSATIYYIVDTNNKMLMVNCDEIAALYRDSIVLIDGNTIPIYWDAYPFLDKALKEKEIWESKIGKVV